MTLKQFKAAIDNLPPGLFPEDKTVLSANINGKIAPISGLYLDIPNNRIVFTNLNLKGETNAQV